MLWILVGSIWGQVENDTIYNHKTQAPIVIDGEATEESWANAEWHAIDKVLIPYGATMDEGDFEGRFKVTWDESYLYVLVEATDDSLSDDHADPLMNWWDDDCVEIFIDEDRSGGDHQQNNNAFAYHVSLSYDAIDLDENGQGINYKDHIMVEMDTIGPNTYLWEIAVKIYDESYDENDPEASRVDLMNDKLMGFAIAYCDNDETTSRENFISNRELTEATANDMYKNADHFGPMVLMDPLSTNVISTPNNFDVRIYPNPARDYLRIETNSASLTRKSVSLFTMSGRLVRSGFFNENTHTVKINDLEAGMYILNIVQDNTSVSRKIIKH